MKARAVITRKIDMFLLAVEDMDRILAGKSGKIVGIPTMFDEKGRFWPHPEEGIVVEIEE